MESWFAREHGNAALRNGQLHVYVARKNGYIGYIVDNQRLKRLHYRLHKVTSVTLLVINWLDQARRHSFTIQG